jgi:hypothetical protein
MKHAGIFMTKMTKKRSLHFFLEATYFTYQESSVFGCKHPLCSRNVKNNRNFETNVVKPQNFVGNIELLFQKCSLKANMLNLFK